MKTYKNLFMKLIDRNNLQKAFIEASKGKRDRKDVKEVLKNLDFHVEILRQMLIDLVEEKLSPKELFHSHRTQIINEGTGRKPREIIKPDYKYEQVIHHAVVQIISPIISKGMSEACAGSVPNRGSKYVMKSIKKWKTHDKKNMKYCGQMDIKSFFKSIPKKILKQKFARIIVDSKMLFVIFCIINCCKKGLPLGFYTSQWFSMFFLQDLDHFIKNNQRIKVGNRSKVDYSKGCGVTHFMRYMDDIVIFGPNKRELHKAVEAINRFLNSIGLRLKENWQVFRMEYTNKSGKTAGRCLDFIGFVFKEDRVILRKTLMLRISAKARRIKKKTKVTWYDACGMISYMGYISNTDTYGFYLKHVKDNINVRSLKRLISRHARKENQNARLENSERFQPQYA